MGIEKIKCPFCGCGSFVVDKNYFKIACWYCAKHITDKDLNKEK